MSLLPKDPKIVIIPLGGIGSRFKKKGFQEPKALVPVNEKPIIFWLIDHLKLDPTQHVLMIPYNSEYKQHNLEGVLNKRYADKLTIRFFCLETQTRGAAETLLVALEHLSNEQSSLGEKLRDPNYNIPVASIDSDSFYICDILSAWNGENVVSSFLDFQPKPIFSYVRLQGDPELDAFTIIDKSPPGSNVAGNSTTNVMSSSKDGPNPAIISPRDHMLDPSQYETEYDPSSISLESSGGQLQLETYKNKFKILEIVEKEKISHRANAGLYGFKSHQELMKYCRDIIEKGITQKGEYYTSTVIKQMIEENHSFYCRPVKNKDFYSLGTPEQVTQFQTTFLLDLDGTLVTTDSTYVSVWNHLLQPFGLAVDMNFFTTFIKGKSDFNFLKYLMPNISDEMLSTISEKKDTEFVRQLQLIAQKPESDSEGGGPSNLRQRILIPGVFRFFELIKNSRIAIVTSCNKSAANYILKITGLSDFITLVIASEDVVNHKPQPDGYLKAITELGVCFFTNEIDKETARSSLQLELQEEANFQADFIYDSYINLDPEKEFLLAYCDNNGKPVPPLSPKEDYDFYAKQIKTKLSHLPIKNVSYSIDNLKTGYICDINAFNIVYNNNNTQTVIFKISNIGNELSKVATCLDLYEKEGYFYERLASYVGNDIAIPKNYGVIRTQGRLGIIMEDLRFGAPGVFNVDLNNDIQMLLQVINAVFKMHDIYYFPSEDDVIPSMRKLARPNTITYYSELIRNRFDKFITRNAIFMSKSNQEVCSCIAKNFTKMADIVSSFPLSFVHGDLKSPNIFYRGASPTSINLPGKVGEEGASPVFLDWQYIHLNKGVSDIVFLLVESIKFDPIIVKIAVDYYHKLCAQKRGPSNYTYEQYMLEFKCSLCMFPYFVMVWFNSEDADKLLDMSFPIKFMKNLLDYYTYYLDVGFFEMLEKI